MSSRGKAAPDGAQRFEESYKIFFGDRWESLRESLKRSEKQVLRKNKFSNKPSSFLGCQPFAPDIYWQSLDSPLRPERGDDQLLDAYIMDPASLAPVWALHVKPGQRVLDLCAAPGGKTLVLSEALFLAGESSGELVANDLSPDRRERLIKVLQQYIPRGIREGKIFVTGKDGVQFGLQQPESFDRILLDAPCSGERHLLENTEELEHWSPRRSEGLAMRQYSLLCSAWLALKPGGRIVYSTCALSELENDAVVRKFLKKKKPELIHSEEGASLSGALMEAAEKTEYGWHFLPDRSGIGPIYFAVLEKSS